MKPSRLVLEWLTCFLRSIAIVSAHSKVQRTRCKIEHTCLLSRRGGNDPASVSLQVVDSGALGWYHGTLHRRPWIGTCDS